MPSDAVALALAVASCVLASGWAEYVHHRAHRRRSQDGCREHRWVYHSLYKEGRMWNRICTWCGRHDTHWSDTQHANWPPRGARIRRDDSMPDEAWREARAELKRLLDQ